MAGTFLRTILLFPLADEFELIDSTGLTEYNAWVQVETYFVSVWTRILSRTIQYPSGRLRVLRRKCLKLLRRVSVWIRQPNRFLRDYQCHRIVRKNSDFNLKASTNYQLNAVVFAIVRWKPLKVLKQWRVDGSLVARSFFLGNHSYGYLGNIASVGIQKLMSAIQSFTLQPMVQGFQE